MVEFGLKLEDNKVADWSEHYLRYEKLKQILKKCKAAQQRYNDLAAKDETKAALIRQRFREGLPTPHSSTSNLTNLAEREKQSLQGKLTPDRGSKGLSAKISDIQEGSASTASQEMSEQTKLLGTSETEKKKDLDKSDKTYGSGGESPTMKRSDSGLIGSFLGRAASGVTDYFNRSFERQVRDSLKEMEKYCKEFEECLVADIDRVNAFYNARSHLLQEQLAFLKESVAHSRTSPIRTHALMDEEHRQGSSEVDDELETPLIAQRKRLGKQLADKLARRISSLGMTPQQKGRKRSESTEVEVELMPDQKVPDDDEDDGDEQTAKTIKEAESIQRALVDQYRSAKLLHNFAIMNYTGFVKIVKKHDKTLKEQKGRYKQAIKPEKICNEGKAVEALADRMELLYAKWFCGGDRSEARAQIMPKKGDVLEMDWSQLRLGYRMGMCSILGLWVCWDCVWGLVSKGYSTIGGRTAFPVFRACGGIVMLQWFWGMSVWVWTRYRVNYIYLFDFNPQIVDSPLAIFNAAVDNTMFFLVAMLLYYKAGAHDIPGDFPPGIFPLALVIYTMWQLIFPIRTRLPMWASIWKVVTAPVSSPSFFHGYVGDIFTSMVKIFQDMAWTVFFLFSGDWLVSEDLKASDKHRWAKTTMYKGILIPLLTLLPLWFRFNQCLRRYADTGERFPHLANALKYALSQTVTLFGAFHPLYLDHNREQSSLELFQLFWKFAFVGSSMYSFTWDVYMDWGLGRPKYTFLGPRLMYPKLGFYYAIIAIDLVLRFAWVLTLIPPDTGANFALPHYLTAVSMILELFRRTIWGFLRLENEHRSNTAGNRRVAFVPLHFSTGHMHEYKQEREHRGISVLLEVAVVTLLVLGACVVSVVAAQHATERANFDL